MITMNNWMNNLDDRLLLKQIIMPGSHDAAVDRTSIKKVVVPTTHTLTQEFGIEGQCIVGSRFFDIRLEGKGKYVGDEIVGFHKTLNMGATGRSAREILHEVYSFLKDNPSEFVILRFTHMSENTGIIDVIKNHHLFKDRINGERMLYTGTGNLVNHPINGMRGKAILIFEEEKFKTALKMNTQSQGFHCFRKYSQNNLKPINGIVTCGGFTSNSDISVVFDNKLGKVSKFARGAIPVVGKFLISDKGQKQKLKEHEKHRKDHLFVLSWTQTGGNIEANTTSSTGGSHSELEKILISYLKGQGQNHAMPNVISMDFVHTHSCEKIVNLNFDAEYMPTEKVLTRKRSNAMIS